MQRRKHIQLDLRVSFIPCRAKDYCEKRHRYRKKKRAAITNQTGPGSGSRREFRSNMFKKKASRTFFWLFIPWLSIGFILSWKFSWEEKKINNLGIKESAGCLSQLGSLLKRFQWCIKNGNFKMTIFGIYRYIFCYKAQKCSHKQRLEQAYNTSIQAVWCMAYEQI